MARLPTYVLSLIRDYLLDRRIEKYGSGRVRAPGIVAEGVPPDVRGGLKSAVTIQEKSVKRATEFAKSAVLEKRVRGFIQGGGFPA